MARLGRNAWLQVGEASASRARKLEPEFVSGELIGTSPRLSDRETFFEKGSSALRFNGA